MKLKLSSAAALALFAGTVHAQSSVTLFGTLDTGLLYQSTSASTFLPKAPNTGSIFALKDGGIYASNWGLKGTEDIGAGYKVNFRLQGSFNSTNGKPGLSDTPGVTAIFNQYASVGVSGPFGTVDAGRQIVPMIYAMADTDVRNAQYFGSILTAWLGLSGGGMAWHQHECTDWRVVRQQCADLSVTQILWRVGRARICTGRRRWPASGRHAGIGGAEVLELRPESVRGVLQRARHQSVPADLPDGAGRTVDGSQQ